MGSSRMVAKKTVSARALFSFVVFILSIVLFFTERKLSDGNRELLSQIDLENILFTQRQEKLVICESELDSKRQGQLEIEVAKETKTGKIEQAQQYLSDCLEKKSKNNVQH